LHAAWRLALRCRPGALGRSGAQAVQGGVDLGCAGCTGLHLRRVRTQADDDGYDMWLASDRPFLPIRIRWTDRDGRITDATVDTIRLAQD